MYSVDCECQQTLEVHAGQAGTVVACQCGRGVSVPRLSDLRVRAGEGAFESGVTSKIERLVGTGELPHGGECVVTGIPTDDYIEIQVLCDRQPFVPSDEPSFGGFGFLALGVSVMWVCAKLLKLMLRQVVEFCHWIAESFRQPTKPDDWALDPANQEMIVVQCPLRMIASHHDTAATTGSRRLKRWLQTVPVYRDLFDQYPQAQCRFIRGIEA